MELCAIGLGIEVTMLQYSATYSLILQKVCLNMWKSAANSAYAAESYV